jgi:FkbM family methyltransferase
MSPQPASSADPLKPSRVSTALMSALVAETRRDPSGMRRQALSALRKTRLVAGDPAVTAMISGRELLMPLSHDLPVHRACHPDYSRNLGRVAAALEEFRAGAPIVDIGANIGDSVAIIHELVPDAPILCIEGDVQFLPYLQHNVRDLAAVEVAAIYVQHAPEDGDAGVAVVRSGGTARLVDQQGIANSERVSVQQLSSILAEHPHFAQPGMIKLDTDGHDADILLQAEDVLVAGQPVVFFEFDPAMAAGAGGTDPHAALDLLARLDYRSALFFTNTGNLARALDVTSWASEVPTMAGDIGPGRPVAYFDVCVFGPDDAEIAGEVERREANIGQEIKR